MKSSEMPRLIFALVALTFGLAVHAMPTRAELSKAQPLVNELMAPVLEEYKSSADKTAGAVTVGNRASSFAAEAETEASKFLLLKGAVNYYVRGEAYEKAADCIATMQSAISNLPPEVVAEIVGKATSRISESKAPRLLAYYRAAKLQVRARKELPVLEKKLRRVKSEQLQRQYAEALAVSGNWKSAYDAFAKSQDKDFVRIVEAEAQGAAVDDQSAELWWNYKPALDGAEDFFKVHAIAFYQRALAKGEISGLRKSIVERRIAQINEEADAVNIAGATPAAGIDQPNTAVVKSDKSIMVKIRDGIELEFVLCPAGSFTMGSSAGGLDPVTGLHYDTFNSDNLRYKHEVIISRPFWMSKYPITVEQFGAFCPINDEFIKQNGKQGEPKVPVCLRVTAAEDYCKWLNRRFVSALPRKCIFRLPTDAEWEYALCANSTDADDPYVRFRNSGKRGILDEICGKKFPVPVGTAGKPNAWGLYDMLGNGCHYVLDTISGEAIAQDACYGCVVPEKIKCGYKESETDPLRLYVPKDNKTKSHHLMRGGSYAFWARKRGPTMHYRMVECGEINRNADRPDRPRIWTFRVVIGPDLVSEKMAKSGKK